MPIVPIVPIIPFYEDEKQNVSRDLAQLLGKQTNLAFDSKSPTGFAGIKRRCFELPEEYQHWTQPKEQGTFEPQVLDRIVSTLIQKMKNYLVENWDSSKFHCIFGSGGADSRIVGWLLASLRDEGFNLGNYCFICHHDEDEMFKLAMKAQGWKEEHCHIHRESWQQNSEYYDFGDFTDNHNALSFLDRNFWSDIVSREKEKETVIVNGFMGGEQFEYPIKYNGARRRWLRNPWSNITWSSPIIHNRMVKYTLQFHNQLMPYCSYDVTNYIMSIPACYFTKTIWKTYKLGKYRQEKRDLLRKRILESFNDDIPTHVGHNYIFNITPKTAAYMKDSWLNSKLFQDFKADKNIKAAEPGAIVFKRGCRSVTDKMRLDQKLYALATCYGKIY